MYFKLESNFPLMRVMFLHNKNLDILREFDFHLDLGRLLLSLRMETVSDISVRFKRTSWAVVHLVIIRYFCHFRVVLTVTVQSRRTVFMLGHSIYFSLKRILITVLYLHNGFT
jgi:hypothetical protein